MCKVFQSVWIVFCTVLCTATASRNAVAEDATSFLDPTGWSVGDANSTYQEWDVFTARSGNAPDIGHFPAPFTPTFSAASPAFKTGTGNLYSYSGDYSWWADIENYGGVGAGTDVIVQIAATLNDGVGVYPNSLAIVRPDGSPILGGDYASVLRDTVLFQGDIWVESQGSWVTAQERLWEFFLPGYTEDFRIEGTSSIHSSVMQARVDSTVVPEPAAIVLFGTGLIGLEYAGSSAISGSALETCEFYRAISVRPAP